MRINLLDNRQQRHDLTFYVRTPKKEILRGVRTFYVPSTTEPGAEYVIKYNSGTRHWSCSCPDWLHRHSVTGGECRHIGRFKAFITEVGGLRKVKRGTTTGHRR